MNATSKLCFSSLLSGKNLFYLILIILFSGLTLAGIWLLVSGQYVLVYPDPLVTAAVSGLSVILAVIFALMVAYQPLRKINYLTGFFCSTGNPGYGLTSYRCQ